MTRIRTAGLFTLVALALGACSAASALAAPPEFVGPVPVPFTAKSGVTTLETVKGAKVTCKADTAAGEVTGPKTGTIKVTFTGCEFVTLGLACNTVGVPPGEIITNTLVMTLGYISEPKKEDGIDLSIPTGAPLMEFTCGPVKAVVQGSVIGKVTPVNKLINPPGHFLLRFVQAKGKQNPAHFEGGPVDVPSTSFGGGPFVESGLASADTIAFPVPFMITA